MKNFENNENDLDENKINFFKEINYYLFFWPWFLVAIIFSIIISFLVIRYSPVIYESNATILIKKKSSDISNFLTQSTQTFFGFERIVVENDVAIINSNNTLGDVSDKLNLQTKIYQKGKIKNSILFPDSVPFKIMYSDKIPDPIDIHVKDGIVELKSIDGINVEVLKNKTIDTFGLIFQPYKELFQKDNKFFVDFLDRSSSIQALRNSLKISSGNTQGDIIKISINGENKQLNEAILNRLIKTMEENQVKDKQRIFYLSLEFLKNRLNTISNTIDSLSQKTINFKSLNSFYTPELQIDKAFENIFDVEYESFKFNVQYDLVKNIKKDLESQSDYSLLPSNIGIDNDNLNQMIISYNELVLKRLDFLSGATDLNPLVSLINDQLFELKQNLLLTLENYLSILQISVSDNTDFKKNNLKKVSEIPELESTLSSFTRNFKIAEGLYAYLLERKEEASIGFISAIPNLKIIDYGYSSAFPVSPNKRLILFSAVLFSIFVPFSILFILKLIDNKIHTREDVLSLFPNENFLGEIPLGDKYFSILNYNPRDIVAEAVRVIRTNIDFMLSNKAKGNVIIVTSCLKGEGKTFCAFNIALSHLSMDKKVLIIGADLRNPKIHSLISNTSKNDKGLSSILSSSSEVSFEDCVITKKFNNKDLHVLISGPIPPNPSELLTKEKFKLLIENLKSTYDYIIIDTAPLLLVSDTFPLIPIADLYILVLKSNYTNKKIRQFIQSIFDKKLLNNYGLVLNGLVSGPNSIYKYSYKYRYTYSYKYNYGYRYGYKED